MIFSIIALTLFMAVFITTNVVAQSAQDLALAITLHADAEAGIPDVDRNGNKWSWEQLRVLRAFAKAIYQHKNGGKPISIAVSAVAGSGKTSLLQGMTHIVAKLCPELLTAMTAFNTHIAASSKDILLQFQSTDGLNVKIFGGSNTVNAGGRSLLMNHAKALGYDDIDFPSYAADRYHRLARLTLAGWLGREDRYELIESARIGMEVATTSHAFNNMIGEGLVKAAQIAMDEGYVPSKTVRSDVPSPYTPPTPNEADVDALAAVIRRVGVNQSWDENPARGLGDKAVFQLVVEMLAVAIETAFLKVELKPYCGEGKSFMDALVPFKKADRPGGWEKWQDLKPVRKQIFSTDPDTIKKAQFAILENGGCRFPAADKDRKKGGVKSISFDTEAKAIVKQHDGVVVMSFENNGHTKRLGGKGIGTQFGFNGDYTVNGERISKWRKYVGSKGYTMVHPEHLNKVIALLTEVFGDEFHNMLDEGTYEEVQHEVVEAGKGTLVLSMADQIYLPHALDLHLPLHEKADVVFIDEVQDLSILKANLVWRLAKEDAHKVIVGDLRQAIYLFAGASSQAFEDNAAAIGAEFFPQTICWRGTEMVAASARIACQQFIQQARSYWSELDVPDYDAHRSPLEAGYDFWPMGAMPVQITANEAVKAYHKSRSLHGEDTTFGLLCRVKKPLATFIKTFIKAGIPVSTPATINGSTGLVDEAFTIASRDRTDALDDTYKISKVKSKAVVGLGWKSMPANKIGQHSLLLRDIENVQNIIIAKYTDMFKGDTKSMAQATEFQELMGNVELLEAFVSLHRERGSNEPVKGKNLMDALKTWVEETLFSERGGAAVHVATIHRYKGDEADVMFIVNQMLGEDDEGEPAPVDCFMSKRACEASPESAVNEVSMGYVAFTRAKKQNIIINVEMMGQLCSDVEQRLQAAFDRDVESLTTDAVQEPQDTPESDSEATDEDSADLDDRCVECSTIIVEGEEHGTCAKCGGHLCRVRIPTHSKSGKYEKHMGGKINDFQTCGSYLQNITLEDMVNGDEASLESKRLCSSCEGDQVAAEDTDWEHELEYVEIEQHDGKIIRMSIEDFDAWEEQNPSFDGVYEARHMSEGDMQGLFFQDTTPREEEPAAPVLPEVYPSPFILMKRGSFSKGSLKAKLHIDANPDEPSGKALCGKSVNIHPTLNNDESPFIGGRMGKRHGGIVNNGREPTVSDKDTELDVQRRWSYTQGWGYNARQITRDVGLTNDGEDGHFCQRCVKKWKDMHLVGPVRGFAIPQHGLLHEMPLAIEFSESKKTGQQAGEIVFDFRPTTITTTNKETDEKNHYANPKDEWDLKSDLANFAVLEQEGERFVVIMPRRNWTTPIVNKGKDTKAAAFQWGSVSRFNNTSFDFEIEISRMIKEGRLSQGQNKKGDYYLRIPVEDELLKNVDVEDLEGEVADFVLGFCKRYMVARCFEPYSQANIAKNHPEATVFDRMFNSLTHKPYVDGKYVGWWIPPTLPHSLKEWEALPEMPKKEDEA